MKYTKGKITEKVREDRIQIEDLTHSDQEDNYDDIEITNENIEAGGSQDDKHSIKETETKPNRYAFLLRVLSMIFLVLFLVFFSSFIWNYSQTIYDSDTSTDTDKHEISTESLDKIEENDVNTADIDMDENAYPTEENPPNKETIKPSAPSDSKEDIFTYSLNLHQSLLDSTQTIKNKVLLYSDSQTNRLSLQSTIEKQQTNYNQKLQSNGQIKLSKDYDEDDQKKIINMINSRLTEINRDVETIKNSSRVDMIEQTNIFIQKENARRREYLTLVKTLMDKYDITYTEANGTLSFNVNQ